SPITFVGNSSSSVEGTLAAGEVSTYVSTYTFDSSGVNAGGISLTVTGTGSTPGNTNNVIDVSNDGDNSDGNTIDDPTQVILGNTVTLVEGTKLENYIDNDSNGTIGLGDQLEYMITIYNNGEEDLESIALFDVLQDFNNNTLALVAPFTPPGPIFVSSDQNSTNGNLLVGETATYKAVYIVQQGSVDSGGLTNCLDVQVNGVNSGRQYTDTADDGDDTDGNITNDCTVSSITATPSLEVTKSASVQDVNGNGVNDPNDIINYNIRIVNDGNVTLSNLSLTDTFRDANGNNISLDNAPVFSSSSLGSSAGTLQVGEIAIYQASYTISVDAANSGYVYNSLLVTASSPGNSNDVSDISDDGIEDDFNVVDDPTFTFLSIDKQIEVTKTFTLADDGDGEPGQNDVVTYSITVQNTGQIGVSGITLVDLLTNCDGYQVLTLSSGPTWNSNSGSSAQGSLAPGEIANYTATYTIGSAEVDSGCILNTVTATASSPGNSNDVSDVSDDGNDSDGNLVDDKTRTNFTVDPAINVTKTGVLIDDGDSLPGAGDTSVFTITVLNTGNTSLSTITLTDTFTRGDGSVLTLDSGPTFNSSSGSSPEGSLQAGESATYTASYTVDSNDVATNSVRNQIIVNATAFNGASVNDTSDNGNDLDGNTENDPTEVRLDYNPILEVTKTVSMSTNTNPQVGDVAVYTITVENKGNVDLNTVALNDTFVGLAGASISLDSGPVFVSSSNGSSEGNLIVGEVATYAASYTITQDAIDSGGFRNTVVASARNPGSSSTDVTDASDDGNDSDGNQLSDPTDVVIAEDLLIEATKTATFTDNDSNGVVSLNDRIDYTILVHNKSNVTLDNISVSDDLTDISETTTMVLDTGPSFSSSNQGSSFGVLKPNEIATFVGTYNIRQSDVDAGGVSNQVSVTAFSPQDEVVSDFSDDGDDFDENTEDDRTETSIIRTPGIEITKTSTITDEGDAITGLGDTITYTIIVENTGNLNLSSVALEDELITVNGNALSLTTTPTFVSSSLGSDQGSLKVNETAEYTATFIINQASIDGGGTSNTVTVTASSLFGSISDVSDDGDDTDGNSTDDPTVDVFSGSLELEATKTAVINDVNSDGETGIGDVINYTIVVENKGTESLTNFSITDTLTDANGNSLSLNASPTSSDSDTIAPGQTKTYTAAYTISQLALDNGGVLNSALVQASNIAGTIFVSDISDDGDDTDSNTVTDTTDVLIAENSSLNLSKTYVNIDNDGNGLISEGDQLVYTFRLENDGNITQNFIYINDAISDFDGNMLSLDSYSSPNRLAFISNSNGSIQGTLISGEIATYTATYTIQNADIPSGGISNTATATSYIYVDGNPVVKQQDVSDDGDDTDGNTDNDPTLSYFGSLPEIEITKTATYTGSENGPNVGDVAVFTITVENKSTQDVIKDLTFVDTLTDTYNRSLSMSSTVTFNSASAGSGVGTITIGETATYTSSYTITQSDIDAGGVINSITFEGTSARNPVPSEKDVKDTSDNGNDLDGNITDDPTILVLGIDSDGDGTPDSTDVDDDDDGILDKDEQCLTFLLDGTSFESYTGSFPPGSPANRNSPYPNTTVAPPFTSVNGDGEVWSSSQGPQGTVFNPQQGFYFIELLTNDVSANDGSYWNESTVGSNGNYDRIMVIENVYPNRSYNIEYYHKEGGRFVATHAEGGTTLLQIQSMNTDYALSNISTPSANWTSNTVSFTTDSQTTRVAILFSAYSPGTNSSIQLDAITMSDPLSCDDDIDGDGIPNGIDLDSDNDGIYDVVESGNEALDTNNDGVINGLDTGFTDTDLNGASDTSESNSLIDSDSDGIIDAFELDSDNDGCNDSEEAGYTDTNSDGILGGSPVITDSKGKVTSGIDGYTIPQDLNSDNTFDYRDVNYDVGCYNPALIVVKSAVVSDTNSNGLNDVGDIINYTVVVTNTGGLPITFTSVDDQYTYGSETKSLTLEWSSSSTETVVTATENLFYYSNRVDDTDNNWNEQNGNQGSPEAEWGYPPGVDYYFDTSSGVSYSEVDYVFTTNGFGTTRSPYQYSNTDSKVSKYSRISNQNVATYYVYEDISLEANTEYTVSVYAAAPNNTYFDTNNDYEKLRFVHRPPGGSDIYGDYNRVTGPVSSQNANNDSGWTRYHHTFTTGSAGTYRVGFSAPYFGNNWTRIWGAQLEKGSKPSRYTYTYNTLVSSTATSTAFADPRSAPLPAGASAIYTGQLTITQEILDSGTDISNQVTITGSFTSPGGISGEISDLSADDDNTDGNTEDDPTVVSISGQDELTVTKIASVSDINSNTLNDVGDIVTYKITIENTGNTNLNSFTITDTLEDSTGQILTQITDTASFTLGTKTNLFKYSQYMDDVDYDWSEEGDIYGSALNSYGHPKNEPYYFSTASGESYSNVDYNFPTNGAGLTRNDNNQSDNRSGAHARIHDYNVVGRYFYQDVTLKANTQYTVSVYASAWNSSYDDAVTDEQMRFVYRPPGGSDTFSDYITFQTNGEWNWRRYSYTFTTGAAGNYRVGIDPPYAGGNGGRFWGAQLEEGGAPTRYVYTWTNTDSAPSEGLPVNIDSNTVAYVDWPTNLPNRNGLDALMVQHDNDILDYPIGNGYWSMIEVEPENFTNFDNRPTSSHFDNYGPYTYNGHRYYIETTGWSWTTHRNNAQAAGGYLWVPNTKEEWDYIRSVIPTNNWIWTGVYQQNNADYQADQQRGGWTTLDDSYVPMPGESTVLSPGAKVEYEFEYTIAQEDVDDGMLINQLYVSANGASGIVSDTSDDGDDTDGNTVDDPTVIEISKISSVTIVKTATVSDVNGDGLNGVGDIIEYTIVVENTGNTQLTSSTILDSLTDGLGNIRSLNSTVSYSSTTATVTGQGPNQNLFYYSNRVDDTDYNWNENGSNNGIPEAEWGYPPGIEYYFDTSSGRSYSEVDHVFTTNGLGTTRSPYLYAGTDNRVHAYSRISNQNVATNYVYQDVTLEANTTYTVSVYAAAPNSTYYNTAYDYEKLRFVHRPPGGSDIYGEYNRVTGPVTNNNSNNDTGWTRYHHTFTTGSAGTYRVGFSAPYFGNNYTRIWGAQLEKGSEPTRYIYTYNSNTPIGNIPTDISTTTIDNNEILEALSIDTYVASYTITQEDVDSKFLSNTATFTGIDPDGSSVVSRTSDDGNVTNGDRNPTIISLASTSTIEVIKTASILDVNNSEVNDVGDIITYTIVVSNTGYTTVNSLTLDDTLIDYNSSSLSYNQPISFLSATSGSTSVSLSVAGVVSYTATYTITQSDVDSGGVSNTILILGSSSGLTNNVTATHQISTDLTDAIPGLELTKQFTTTDTNGNNKVDLGDIINYTITAENTGNVELSGLSFTDTMTTYFGESLTLTSEPSYSSSTDASTSSGTIAVGETETYEATFTITQQSIDAGGVYNTISAVASSPTNSNNVSDTSDNGDDTDGNSTDDLTDTTFDVNPKIRVTKTAEVQDVNGNTINDVGDIIVYEILVSNVGDMKISSLSLVDTISDSNGNTLTLNEPLSSLNSSSGSSSTTLLIRGSTTYTTSYTITQSDLNAGSVINSVEVVGSSSTNSNNVSNTTEVETILESVSPEIEITKVASITDNGDGVNGVGDIVNYYVTIENTGNVPVENPTIEDILTDGSGNTLSLTVPLTYGSTTKTITTDLGVGAVDFTSTANGKWDGQFPTNNVGHDYAQYSRNGFYRSVPNTTNITGLIEFNDGRTVQAGYTYVGAFEGHSYMRNNSTSTWTNQRDVAISIGGYLANITTPGEREYLNSVLPNSWYWVGLYQDTSDPDYSEPAGGWKWIDGSKEEKLGSNIWPNNEPNDTSSSNSRGYFYITSDYIRTADRPNTGSYKYIVEFNDGRTSQAGFIRLNGTFEGHTYFVSSSDVTWDVAKTTAESLGGNLVIIDSSQEWGWIRNQEPDWDDFISSNPHWIGLFQDPNAYDFSEPQGGWRWVNGVPLQGPLTTYTITNTIDTDNVIGVDNIDRYTAKYLITQSDFDSGSISNVVSLTGSSPSRSNDASDVSDDGIDDDGNTTNDPTETFFSASPSMEVTKVATVTDVNGNGENDLNDIIEYSIYIHNKGNVNLSTPTLVDYLSDGVATDLTSQLNGPTYHSQTLSPTTVNLTVTVAQVDGSNKYFINGKAQKELVLQKGYTYRFDQSSATNSSHPFSFSTTTDGTHNSGVSYTTSVTVVGTPGNAGAYTEIYVVESTPILYYYCSAHNGMGGKAFTIGSVAGQLGIIRPNEVMTYTASYTISGASASTAFISNVVTVTTSSPGNSNDITDLADDGDDADGNTQNDPTIVDLVPAPEMELTKTGTITFDNGDGMISPGDRITYTIKLENTGNLLINNISLTDTMADGNGVPLNLDSGPTFVQSSLGSVNGILQLTEVATYTAVYTITNSTANSGLVSNSIYVIGSAGGLSNNVTETSDDGDDTDGNTEDDSTVIQIPELPSIEVTKIYTTNDLNGNGVIDLGDRINYTITVENTGNQDLTGLNLDETFTNLTTDTLSLSSGPNYSTSTHSNAQGLLVYGETETYVANYIIEQLAIDGAGVSNVVIATISSPGNSNNVTDTSDDGDDTDGNTEDDATITEFVTNPSIDVTKTAQVNDTNSNSRTDTNDIITYTITVQNTGDTEVNNISFNDIITTSTGNQLSLTANPARISTSAGSSLGTLLIGETAIYTAQFIINQTAYDAEFISNTVTVTADSIGQTGNVSDTSDDGDDTDGNTEDDPTITVMTPQTELEVTKTFTVIDGGDDEINVGDFIRFSIEVENTGNAPLNSITIEDVLKDGDGNVIPLTEGPYYVSGSQGSTEGNLANGEIGTYVAFFTINQQAYDSGSISNVATATGSSDYGTNDAVDVSDDGNDLDGNTTDDPTEVIITSQAKINVEKTASIFDEGDGFTNVGDTINYLITVTNNGATALSSVTLTDNLTDNVSNTLTLTNGPNFISASQGSSEGSLNIGEVATYNASYLIQQAAANSGAIYNQVIAVASSPGQVNDVTDTSDDGDDTDGNTTDDQTIVDMDFSPIIDITKTAIVRDNNSNSLTDFGDAIVYEIRVANIGNVTINSLTITDTLTDGNLNTISLSSGPNFVSSSSSSAEGTLIVGETATYSATVLINQTIVDAGILLNSVYGLASSPGNSNNVSDTSDDGDDSDGET
ncbi:hypothetical protein OAF03_02020, partial [Flavobacteriaceae bacterium]|nr:hypothetical protein [Flavobacteriaceae bacterium]